MTENSQKLARKLNIFKKLMIINAIKVKNLTFWVNFDEFQELKASFIDFCSRKHQDLLKESKKIHENWPKIEKFSKY